MIQHHLKKAVVAILTIFSSMQLWSQSVNDVRIINQPDSPVMEIRNGLVGIVIPKQTTFDAKNARNTLAPIQSVIYNDGTYSDNTPNFLQSEAPPISMSVTIVKNTPAECIVKTRYVFNKPLFHMYEILYPGGEAKPGFYQNTISLKKGAKSIMVEEDSDYDVWYEVKISNGLVPDKGRYRGWSSLSVAEGYEPSGIAYRGADKRAGLDATVDINYDREKVFPMLSLWDPAGGEVNTGRYWQFYNSGAPANSNLIGFFQGRASRMVGAKFVGPRFIARPTDASNKNATVQPETKTAFIQVYLERRGPDNSWYPRKRFEWGVFISTKKDLRSADQYQPIGIEMNTISGLATRIDAYAKKPAEIIPDFFNASIYMSDAKVQALIKRVKTDESFYQGINHIDPYFKDITDVWKTPPTADKAIDSIIRFGEELRNNFKNGDGIHAFTTKYWMGSFIFKRMTLQIACMFADKSISISPAKKEQLLQIVRMMARIQWDDDNVPFFDSSGINFGTANMYYQYKNNGRNFFAMLFAKDPEFSKRAKQVLNETKDHIKSAISETGASFGSPHYTQATIDPILYSMLQLKEAGISNLFVEEKSRINKFVDFYTSLLTPPSVRFNNYRKLISIGDGSEESAVTFGLLATGLRDSDPALSEKLYSIFQHGAPRSSLFGDVALAIDFDKNYTAPLNITSSTYKDYLSHLRSGINTGNESAAWIVNGDGYSDHRNDDRGEAIIFALKAPLSLSRSSFYFPRADDPRIRSLVIPESEFPQWNTANQPINSETGSKGNVWAGAEQLEFAKLGNSSLSLSRMKAKDKQWIRRVVMINIQEEQPVILFYDSINNNKPNIWSMLFMSQGAIKTTAGDVTPDDRIFDGSGSLRELPRATPEKKLAAGLNKFSFTGQQWPQSTHASGGINWDMFSISNGSASFTTSQWTNNWQNAQEAAEYQSTMGRPYTETQQILRVKNDAAFFHILLPYFKGTEPYKNNVHLKGNNKMQIKYNKGILLLGDSYYFYEGSDRIVASSFNNKSFNENGYSITGGVTEIVVDGNDISVRVHGNSGKRTITLPFEIIGTTQNAQVKIQARPGSSLISIDYKSKGIDVLSTEQGYTGYNFKKK